MSERTESQAPLVDVGITTYGQPTYLHEAIESVLAQSLGSWRLTITENGSGTDEIAEIVRRYRSDRRVSHVTTGSNIGGARNATNALRSGRARYVALLHDDDRWGPEFLAARAAFLEINPDCGMVFSDCNFIDNTGRVVFRLSAGLPHGVQPRKAFLRKLYRRNIISIPTVLMRRSSYVAVGAAFNHTVLFYDYEMWLRIASRYDVGYLDTCDASYRVHEAQTTRQEDLRLGEHRLRLLEAMDGLMPDDFSKLERRRSRSAAFFQLGRDALARGERRQAAADLICALREYPAAALDPTMAAMFVGSQRRRARQREVWMRGYAR